MTEQELCQSVKAAVRNDVAENGQRSGRNFNSEDAQLALNALAGWAKNLRLHFNTVLVTGEKLYTSSEVQRLYSAAHCATLIASDYTDAVGMIEHFYGLSFSCDNIYSYGAYVVIGLPTVAGKICYFEPCDKLLYMDGNVIAPENDTFKTNYMRLAKLNALSKEQLIALCNDYHGPQWLLPHVRAFADKKAPASSGGIDAAVTALRAAVDVLASECSKLNKNL